MKQITKLSLLLAFVLTVLSFSASGLLAQDDNGPSTYCILGPDAVQYNAIYGYPSNFWCYPDYLHTLYPQYYSDYLTIPIKDVKVTEVSSGAVKMDNNTGGFNYCYFYTGKRAELTPGESYKIETIVNRNYLTYSGTDYCQYGYTLQYVFRVFIDWNIDGDFNDPGEWINNPNENNSIKLGATGSWSEYNYCDPNHYMGYQVKVKDDQPLGTFRMRIMSSYYYPYDANSSAFGYQGAKNACWNGYAYAASTNPLMYYGYCYGETEDYLLTCNLPFKNTFPSDKAPDDILLAGEKYDGTQRINAGNLTDFKKPMVQLVAPQPVGSVLTYQIIGPLPEGNVIYEGKDPVSGSTMIPVGSNILGSNVFYYMQAANGPAAVDNNGTFKTNNGGEYQLVVGLQKPGGKMQYMKKNFTVSWAYDISSISIDNPLTSGYPRYFKYPRGLNIPLRATLQNVGLFPAVKFDATYTIYDSKGNVVMTKTINYDTAQAGYLPIYAKQKTQLDFGSIKINNPDLFSIVFKVHLLNADDNSNYNDQFPRVGNPPYTFEVRDEIQAQAWAIVAPVASQEIIAGRPFQPQVTLRNDGVGDISNAPVKMVIQQLPSGDRFEENLTVEDIPSGRYNLKDVLFSPLILNKAGNYSVTFTVSHPDDLIPDDNTKSANFTVTSGLVGTYTIGTKNAGQAKNYTTIDAAMDDLYYRGMNGSVTYEFTDPNYTVSSRNQKAPAWDLSTHILGLGKTNTSGQIWTLTFKPSAQMSATRSAVTITLNSANGQGVFMGQALQCSNNNAVQHQAFGQDYRKSFSDNGGYITFDGGENQAMRFILNSKSASHGSVFYLNAGSHDMTVKNIVMETSNPTLISSTTIPNVNFTLSDGFVFYPDTSLTEKGVISYSAGIVNRGQALYFKLDANEYALDTIPNVNNTFMNNDINGFGFGIVSLGIGPLRDKDHGVYKRYYNTNTTIQGNRLYNLGRAGIFVGNEESGNIQRNNIFDVKGTYSNDAAGIIIGGNATVDFLGYNNMNLKVNANKISNVRGNSMVTGIIFEQDANYYPQGSAFQIMPDMPDNISITSNAIFDIKSLNSNTDRAGIYVYTQRDLEVADKSTRMITPEHKDYWLRGMEVVNNTVILDEDGLTSNGNIAGIAAQNAKELMIKNNAVAISDNSINGNNDVAALVFIQGQYPDESNIVSDRNAYFSGSSDVAAYRHVYTDNMSNVILTGSRNEYKSLEQWQMQSGNELNSVYGFNFLGDYQYVGTYPQDLKIKSNVKGSVLSRRGDKIADVTTDVNGATRGVAGARYDVGAVEFNGSLYNTDAEALVITAPGTYRATTGTFSDAEYNMTEAPIAVTARIRNSGSIQLTNRKVSATISRMDASGNWVKEVGPITVTVTVESSESADVNFGLADGIGTDFVPQTYNDLSSAGYTVPATFKGMEANVTPLYKISISMESDEVSANNTIEKVTRFYLKRSGLSMLISNDNYVNTTTANLPNLSVNDLATGLNRDAISSALLSMGWKLDLTKNVYDYDMFNRTGWEPRNVNYTPYRTVIWSDGNDQALTRTQRLDFENFLASGTTVIKKNLIIGSQEMVRANTGTINSSVLSNILRASNRFPYSPLGNGVSYSGKKVMGVTVGRNLTFDIKATGIANDANPIPGLMDIAPNGDGLPLTSFYYLSAQNPDWPVSARIGGVSTSTLTDNVEYLGVDWRHFGDINTVMRAAFDFVEGNGGIIVPIDLLTFSARQTGNRVDLNWQTASEQNSDRFDVERAEMTPTGKTSFTKIAEVKALGNSNVVNSYGPVADANVNYGKSYVYRLRMLDRDGNFKLSDEQTVNMQGGDLSASMEQVLPNPSITSSNLTYSLGNDGEIELAIYDETGKKVETLVSGSQKAGSYTVTINSRNLAAGTYRVVMNAAGTILTSPLNVVR